MKFNINPKELLALYNVLYDRFDGPIGRELSKCKTEDPAAQEAIQLKQVYVRLRAILLAGLANPGKSLDPVDNWFAQEDEKIGALAAQNEKLKEIAKDPVKLAPKLADLANILADDDDEVPRDTAGYPKARKRPPPPKFPYQGGKHKGRFSNK